MERSTLGVIGAAVAAVVAGIAGGPAAASSPPAAPPGVAMRAGSTPTVPLLTGGILTYTGSGSATAHEAGGDYSDDESVDFGAFSTSYLTPMGYPHVPTLDQTAYPEPHDGRNWAISWPAHVGSATEDIRSANNSYHCDFTLTGTRPKAPTNTFAPGSSQQLPPFGEPDDGFPDCGGGAHFHSRLTEYAHAQIWNASNFDVPAQPFEGTQRSQTVSVDGPVQGYACGTDESCNSHLTFSGTMELHCVLCVTDISLSQLSDPTSGDDVLAPVPDTGTYDGNRVEITATVDNVGPDDITSFVTFVDGKSGRYLREDDGTHLVRPIVFPAGKSTTVTYDWDTSGYAWENGKPQTLRQVEVLTPLGGAYRNLTVLPKPVVLVHGWNSDASTWEGMKALISGVSLAWRGYAVGDDPAWSPAMDTDPVSGRSLDANAFTMGQYVDKLRHTTGAQHVDLVAHSMGGLISRDYIDKIMGSLPLPPGARPVATHLVMLGTPNMGSPCAIPMSAVASQFDDAVPTFQLRPDFVDGPFNASVTHQRGVEFSVMAGYGYSVCGLDQEGDGVVSVPSAWWHLVDVAKTVDLHTSLPGDGQVFSSFVEPRLALDPDQVPHPGASRTAPRTTARSSSTPTQPSSQLALAEKVLLKPGKTKRLHVVVPKGATSLQLTTTAPPSTSVVLKGPDGSVAARQGGGAGATPQPFRGAVVGHPRPGRWTIALKDAHGAPQVLVAAGLTGKGPALRASSVRTKAGLLVVKGRLLKGKHVIKGGTMTAYVRGTPDPTPPLNLHDDGRHHDKKAHDGVYGGTVKGLDPGQYFVTVKVTKKTITRVTGAFSRP